MNTHMYTQRTRRVPPRSRFARTNHWWIRSIVPWETRCRVGPRRPTNRLDQVELAGTYRCVCAYIHKSQTYTNKRRLINYVLCESVCMFCPGASLMLEPPNVFVGVPNSAQNTLTNKHCKCVLCAWSFWSGFDVWGNIQVCVGEFWNAFWCAVRLLRWRQKSHLMPDSLGINNANFKPNLEHMHTNLNDLDTCSVTHTQRIHIDNHMLTLHAINVCFTYQVSIHTSVCANVFNSVDN